MAGIFQFFTSLLKKFTDLCAWFLSVFKQVFIDLWNMISDLVCWFFESALALASGALSAIDVPFNPQTYYALVPPEASQMLGYIGITQALTLVVASLLIRFSLQTIPFVRWGS